MSEITGYDPDFIERNGTWLLSLVGIMVTCFSGLLAFFLKSRCQTIKCCGCECQRDVLNLERVPAEQLKVELDKRQSPDTPVPAVAGAVPSLVTQALRFPRRKPPSVPVEVELPTTNSESV